MPIYMCISWCSKICWFPVKKCWCQQNSRDVSSDLYIFWIFLRYGICVADFREGGQKAPPPHPWAAPKTPILNRVKANYFSDGFIILLYLISSLSLTKSLLIPYAYISIESINYILLSSFKLKAILLISSVKTLCVSVLKLFCVFKIDKSLNYKNF